MFRYDGDIKSVHQCGNLNAKLCVYNTFSITLKVQ